MSLCRDPNCPTRGLHQHVKLKKSMATPLQTAEERGKMRGQAFRYARDLMLDSDRLADLQVGRAPFSHIDAETIAQKAWTDGYIAALRDKRKEK